MSKIVGGILYYSAKVISDLEDSSFEDIDSYMANLSFFVQKTANICNIGINLHANISQNIKAKLIKSDTENHDRKQMFFELSDSPYTHNCEKLFSPDWNSNESLKIRIGRVQSFFEKILLSKYISNILLEIYDGDNNFDYHEIKVNRFCDILTGLYDNNSIYIPSVKFNISV